MNIPVKIQFVQVSNITNQGWLSCLLILHGCLACVCNAQESRSVASDAPEAGKIGGYELAFPAMGTLVSLKAFHADKAAIERAFMLAERRVHELEAVLTDYDPESETRKLSQSAVAGPVKVSDDLWNVLAASDEWNRATGNAFDSSLGALTQLYRRYRRVDRVPSQEQIEQALDRAGWQHIQLDASEHSVRFDRNGLQLDFGAIGKGYVVDAAFHVLMENDVSSCLVNISGNMRAGDSPPGRAGWRIEIAPLEKDGQPLRRLALVNQAIATSGDLWQYVLIDGKRRSHILDPQTGYGVLGPISATVLADSATAADAMATAACVVGFKKASKIASEMGAMELLMAEKVTHDRPQVQWTPGFPE